MKAFVLHEFGPPDVLHLEEATTPAPGPGEVRIRVQAVAVARTKDVAARAGRPPFGPQIQRFPHILGTEHAGVVDALGEGVSPDLAGRRVTVSAVLSCGQCRACRLGREEACAGFRLLGVHRPGSYAEYVVVPSENLHGLPDDVTFAQGAAIAANGPVARAQLDAGGVGEGSVVLVVGAAGSLGSTAAALAAFRGARVVGVDRLSARPDCMAGLPLAAALDGESLDLTANISAVAGTWGVDCVIDNLGLASLWEGYRPTLGDMGRIVVSGAISRDPLPMQLLPFYLRSQSLIGVRTGNRHQMKAVWADVQAGFRPPATHLSSVSWLDVAEAHRRVEDGTALGQTVLEVG